MGHSHQPTQSIKAPRVCRAGLCCERRLTVPSNLNLPVLGSTTFAEINAQMPAHEYLYPIRSNAMRAAKGKGRDMAQRKLASEVLPDAVQAYESEPIRKGQQAHFGGC